MDSIVMINPLTIGLVGVALMLTAFFLNLFKLIKVDSKSYIILNVIGPGLATYYAFLVDAIPFVIFEGVWTAFAVYKFITVIILKSSS
jgi:hypothetical protein